MKAKYCILKSGQIFLAVFSLCIVKVRAAKVYQLNSASLVQQTGDVAAGATDQPILKLVINVTSAGGGGAVPLTTTSISFDMQNTMNQIHCN